MYVEITNVMDGVSINATNAISINVTGTVPTNSNDKKVRYEIDCYIFYTFYQ